MIVGFDFDCTVYDTDGEMNRVVKAYCEERGMPFSCLDSIYNFAERYRLNGKAIGGNVIRELWGNCRLHSVDLLFKEAVDWLKDRQKKGDTLHCVTARKDDGTETDNIAACLAEVGLVNVRVHTNVKDKSSVCKEQGIDIYFDDCLDNFLEGFSDKGCRCVLLDRAWNRGKTKPSYVKTITKWIQADSLIGGQK